MIRSHYFHDRCLLQLFYLLYHYQFLLEDPIFIYINIYFDFLVIQRFIFQFYQDFV